MSSVLANINSGRKLKELIGSLNFEYGILQSISKIHIDTLEELKKELKGDINPLNFELGRLFSKDFEVRWRKKSGDSYYTLIISDIEQIFDGYEKKELKRINDIEQSFYLWGKKVNDMWYETRIPQGWKYPVTTQCAKIRTIEYEVLGKVEEGKFHRFCGFAGVSK